MKIFPCSKKRDIREDIAIMKEKDAFGYLLCWRELVTSCDYQL